MSYEWITHKGKQILFMKFGGLSKEEQLDLIKKCTQIIVDTKRTDNLTMFDVSNMFASEEFMAMTRENSKITTPFVKRSAVIGVEGVKKVLLNALNAVQKKPRVAFSNIEQAKDWLVE
jgi:hypothetical protein